MTQAHKTPGAKVEFLEKMYKAPYAPFYDGYKGLVFEVKSPAPGNHLKIWHETTGEFLIHPSDIRTV